MITTQKGSDTETPLDYKMFSKMVLRAQKQIEGNNFDRRKTVLQYDEVMRRQREIIYKQRTDILFLDNIEESANGMIEEALTRIYNTHANDIDTLYKNISVYFHKGVIDKQILETEENKLEYILDEYRKEVTSKKEIVGEKVYNDFLKAVTLKIVDTYWIRHIDAMSELRQAVSLQGYGQNNPFMEYQEVGFNMFQDMIHNIQNNVALNVLRAKVRDNTQRVQVAKPIKTYSGKEDQSVKENLEL